MSVPRKLRKFTEFTSCYYYDPVREEMTHLRPHWSDKNRYHVDVYDVKDLLIGSVTGNKKIPHKHRPAAE